MNNIRYIKTKVIFPNSLYSNLPYLTWQTCRLLSPLYSRSMPFAFPFPSTEFLLFPLSRNPFPLSSCAYPERSECFGKLVPGTSQRLSGIISNRGLPIPSTPAISGLRCSLRFSSASSTWTVRTTLCPLSCSTAYMKIALAEGFMSSIIRFWSRASWWRTVQWSLIYQSRLHFLQVSALQW